MSRKSSEHTVLPAAPMHRNVQQHPLARNEARLPTLQLEEFVNTLRAWLKYLLPGGTVWGNTRTGKSEAIEYVRDSVEELLGAPIPVYVLSCLEDRENITKNSFYMDLLDAIKYAFPEAGTAGKKRRRAVKFLAERAQEKGENRVLLFVDEAQWLSTSEYRYLMDLHNQLRLARVRLVVILIGQPEIQDIKVLFRSTKQGHLIGRFMTCSHRFYGVRDKDDVARILESLDATSEYPTGSGCSYTNYFVPKAFAAGFRLAKYGDKIWNGIVNACMDEGITKVGELPMQAVTAMIRALLLDLVELDEPGLELNEALIAKAINDAALVQIRDHLLGVLPASNSTTASRPQHHMA